MSQSQTPNDGSDSAASNSSDDRMVRQPAKRVLPAEFDRAIETFQESDHERAPNFTLLPTGERANRVFVVGTLTEAGPANDDESYFRGRVVAPTGDFYVGAGQYQPQAMAALRSIEPPAFVAVVGKPDQFDTSEEGEEPSILASITPESITVVDRETRDHWVVEAAQHTLARVDAFERDGAADDVARAREAYGEDLEDYRAAAEEALEDVAGE